MISKPKKASSKVSAFADAPVPAGSPRILHRAPRVDANKKNAKELALGGSYRVIHGQVSVPRPMSERLNPDGTENPHEPKVEYAQPGDVVSFSDEDAMRLLDSDIIEPLDAKPSRVGKVWAPPASVRNKNAA